MRQKLLFLILWWIISSLWGASPGLAQAAGCTVTVSGAGAFSQGSNVILTATASASCPPISQVSYYNGANTPPTLLGSSSTGPSYSFTWNTTGVPLGTYTNIFATAYFAGSAGSTGTTIDMVGNPTFGPNPAMNSSFGEGGAGSWVSGDNQMCETSTWPYNGSTSSIPDGTCELNDTGVAPPPSTPTTVDSLDDTMHTLSDFVNFANGFLGQSVGSLSSSIDTWYPQVAQWISSTCDDGSTCDATSQCHDGTMCGRLIPLPANLKAWSTVISNWLGQTYVNANTWCVPSDTPPLAGTAEEAYINTTAASMVACQDGSTCTGGQCKNGNTCSVTVWGDLPHVIACLSYNSNPSGGTTLNSSVYNYQQCVTALTSGTCPTTLPTQCAASALGRSLLGTAAPAYDGCTGNYWTWLSNSVTLATNEAPKFALRSAFLTDVFNRAETMQIIFPMAYTELNNFLTGPAAQLISIAPCDNGSACVSGQCSDGTQCTPSPTVSLPNSVIYGWVDPLPGTSGGGCTDSSGNRIGCAHIVKVTAYAAARNGSSSNDTVNSLGSNTTPLQAILPWIKTTVHLFTRDYELRNRDGLVYVSVRRWDQDHSNSILFPNGHPLWQFLFHNPNATTTAGQGLPGQCTPIPVPGSTGSATIGLGLEGSTVQGLGFANISNTDQKALANAFMLNDEGTGVNAGKVDPNASPQSAYNSQYLTCLSQVNCLLATAPESHACVEYIASSPSSDAPSVVNGVSQKGDADYSLKFVNCNYVTGYPPPADLAYQTGCS